MDETYGTYVDDECFDIHDYDGDTDHDTDDDTDDDTDEDTNDDTDEDTDDGGAGTEDRSQEGPYTFCPHPRSPPGGVVRTNFRDLIPSGRGKGRG